MMLGDNTITPGRVAVRLQLPGVGGRPQSAPVDERPVRARVRRADARLVLRGRSRERRLLRRQLRRARRRASTTSTRASATAVPTVPEENRKLLTYHDSWAYWAREYGFDVIGAVQASDFSRPQPAGRRRAHRPDPGRAGPGGLRVGGLPEPGARADRARDRARRSSTSCATTSRPARRALAEHTYLGMLRKDMEIMIGCARRQGTDDLRRHRRDRHLAP